MIHRISAFKGRIRKTTSAGLKTKSYVVPYIFLVRNLIDAEYPSLMCKFFPNGLPRSGTFLKEHFAHPDPFIGRTLEAISLLGEKSKSEDILFNQSITLFVSSFEEFLRTLFICIINEDAKVRKKLLKSNRKIFIPISSLKSKNIGERVAANFNFQNLQSIQEAFRLLSDRSLLDIMNFDVMVGKKMEKSTTVISKLINVRHDVVHKFQRYKFDWNQISEYSFIFLQAGYRVWLAYAPKNMKCTCHTHKKSSISTSSRT